MEMMTPMSMCSHHVASSCPPHSYGRRHGHSPFTEGNEHRAKQQVSRTAGSQTLGSWLVSRAYKGFHRWEVDTGQKELRKHCESPGETQLRKFSSGERITRGLSSLLGPWPCPPAWLSPPSTSGAANSLGVVLDPPGEKLVKVSS